MNVISSSKQNSLLPVIDLHTAAGSYQNQVHSRRMFGRADDCMQAPVWTPDSSSRHHTARPKPAPRPSQALLVEPHCWQAVWIRRQAGQCPSLGPAHHLLVLTLSSGALACVSFALPGQTE